MSRERRNSIFTNALHDLDKRAKVGEKKPDKGLHETRDTMRELAYDIFGQSTLKDIRKTKNDFLRTGERHCLVVDDECLQGLSRDLLFLIDRQYVRRNPERIDYDALLNVFSDAYERLSI